MADDGAIAATGGHGGGGSSGGTNAMDAPMPAQPNAPKKTATVSSAKEDDWSQHDDTSTPNPFSRRQTSMDLEDYFEGPRDMSKHSKWPLFLQMHGSILPKMIIPLLCVGGWATLITCLDKNLDNVQLGISSVLLTVTGFVVGLGLSFRTSTAYERYAEGRRFWAQLNLTCQSLGRVFWIHGKEREENAKGDLLAKLTALNLLIAFAVSLKHKLRFEPYSYYEDLTDLIDHLDTYAKSATTEDVFRPKKPGFFKNMGERLGLSFAASNPRKAVKKAQTPIGNLPLEILTYLAAYTDDICLNGQLPIGMTQTHAYNGLQALNDVLSNTERVLTTPLPIAYTISISQITWVYVILLPFQLLPTLDWMTIPAAVAAAYIILGILFIGREVENPFGTDVNDLPLELYCAQIVNDIETLTSRPRPRLRDYVNHPRNKVMFPSSRAPFAVWESRPEPAIRIALSNRPYAQYERAISRAATTVQRTKSNPEKKTTPSAESAV